MIWTTAGEHSTIPKALESSSNCVPVINNPMQKTFQTTALWLLQREQCTWKTSLDLLTITPLYTRQTHSYSSWSYLRWIFRTRKVWNIFLVLIFYRRILNSYTIQPPQKNLILWLLWFYTKGIWYLNIYTDHAILFCMTKYTCL